MTQNKVAGGCLLLIAGIVGLVFVQAIVFSFMGVSRETKNAVAPSQTNKSAPPEQKPPLNKSTVQTGSRSYKNGYQNGLQEGKRWSRDPEQGMPLEEALVPMSRNVAGANRKGSDDNWQNGWFDGFKKGFAAGRGRRYKNAKESTNFEPLSWENADAGVKLYDSNENHAATVISLDESSGLITVRYVNGTVEPKSLIALSQFWSVKRN